MRTFRSFMALIPVTVALLGLTSCEAPDPKPPAPVQEPAACELDAKIDVAKAPTKPLAQAILGKWVRVKFGRYPALPELYSTEEYTRDGKVITERHDPQHGRVVEIGTYEVVNSTVLNIHKTRTNDKGCLKTVNYITEHRMATSILGDTQREQCEFVRAGMPPKPLAEAIVGKWKQFKASGYPTSPGFEIRFEFAKNGVVTLRKSNPKDGYQVEVGTYQVQRDKIECTFPDRKPGEQKWTPTVVEYSGSSVVITTPECGPGEECELRNVEMNKRLTEALIGKWRQVTISGHPVSPGVESSSEYSRDGTVTFRSSDPKYGYREETGTYRVDGDRVHYVFANRKPPSSAKWTVIISEINIIKMIVTTDDTTPGEECELRNTEAEKPF